MTYATNALLSISWVVDEVDTIASAKLSNRESHLIARHCGVHISAVDEKTPLFEVAYCMFGSYQDTINL